MGCVRTDAKEREVEVREHGSFAMKSQEWRFFVWLFQSQNSPVLSNKLSGLHFLSAKRQDSC